MLCCVAPIGLLLGRVANFVNGELYGRVTGTDFGIIFPGEAGPDPRHPSQLYEAALEGLLLFIILRVMFSRPAIRNKPGILAGTFFLLYGVFRFFVEFYREPDSFLGFVAFGATMGQLLCIPMMLVGLGFIFYARRNA